MAFFPGQLLFFTLQYTHAHTHTHTHTHTYTHTRTHTHTNQAESFTYNASEMCGSPATDFGYIDPGLLHQVTLTGLTPGTRYFYICGDENFGWSQEFSFTASLPANPQLTTTAIVYGGIYMYIGHVYIRIYTYSIAKVYVYIENALWNLRINNFSFQHSIILCLVLECSASHSGSFGAYLVKIRCMVFVLHKLCIHFVWHTFMYHPPCYLLPTFSVCTYYSPKCKGHCKTPNL